MTGVQTCALPISDAGLRSFGRERILDLRLDARAAEPVAPGAGVKVEDTAPVTRLNVKSVITAPAEGSRQKPGWVRIKGAAWAGDADVTRVDISTDEGRTWNQAQLGEDHAKYAWRLFHYEWRATKPGAYTVMSRATDSLGRVQPGEQQWNPSGYLWNVIDRVSINVQV